MTKYLDNLPALVIFSRIAQYGSMSKAAQSLGLGRSAVSKQLRALEERLGH
jgi:DNA-binding transcriptional LysR family regulator